MNKPHYLSDEDWRNFQTGTRRGDDGSQWPEPDMRLVEDDRTPVPTLGDDALPAGWEEWIAREAASRGCPRDYVGAALIAAASAWVGNSRHVAVNGTWSEPPHLWLALIGAPSTGKTPALRPIIEACRAIERDAEPEWKVATAEHAKLAEAARAIEEQWRVDVRSATKSGTPAPTRPDDAAIPAEPPRPRLVAMDATTEELQHLLAHQPRGLLYTRDELSGWLGNLDRYGGHGGDRAFFLEAWNGGAYVVDRRNHSGQPVRIARASVAMLGGLQPDRLREALAGADDGLAARFCYVWPDPPPIGPITLEYDDETRDRRERLTGAARLLCGLKMGADYSGDPAPHALRLDGTTLALFDEMRQDAMRLARASRGLAAGWHGKTPGRAVRLALVFELLAWAAGNGTEPLTVSGDAMIRAGGYLDYLAGMFDRVTGGLAIGPAEADAAVIARHILSTLPATLNERALYQQAGWSWLRPNERRAATFRVLADAGWIRPAAHTGVGRRSGGWNISPRLRRSSP